jgi:proline dehydrogenase
MDFVDSSRSMNIEVISQLISICRNPGPLFKVALTQEELGLAKALFARLDRLAHMANELGVKLMIDAEQTYFQPCIDANVLRLQRLHNRGSATIYGTYQCYLKDADARVSEDLERSKREGWYFAAKLVRGAYMVSERKLAAEQGVPSPVHDTIAATHASYHKNVELLLRDENAEVMIATHNQASCEFAAKKMDELGLPRRGSGVHFGQLLGMSDHITFTLGLCGYSAFKYLPYGHVHEVLPYLIRRAQENSGLMAGAVHERRMIRDEVTRRVLGRAA